MLHHKMRKRRPVATTEAKEMRGGGLLLPPGGATRSFLQACGGCAHQKPQDERVNTDSRLCNRWKSQFKQHWSSFLSLTYTVMKTKTMPRWSSQRVRQTESKSSLKLLVSSCVCVSEVQSWRGVLQFNIQLMQKCYRLYDNCRMSNFT